MGGFTVRSTNALLFVSDNSVNLLNGSTNTATGRFVPQRSVFQVYELLTALFEGTDTVWVARSTGAPGISR